MKQHEFTLVLTADPDVVLYSRTKDTPLGGFDEMVISEHSWKGRPRYSLFLAGSLRLEILTTHRGRDIAQLAERLAYRLTLPINNQSGLSTEQHAAYNCGNRSCESGGV